MSNSTQLDLNLNSLFNTYYYSNSKPPTFPPPNNNDKILFKSPPLKWAQYDNDTPPQFYLNQKFDLKKIHKNR